MDCEATELTPASSVRAGSLPAAHLCVLCAGAPPAWAMSQGQCQAHISLPVLEAFPAVMRKVFPISVVHEYKLILLSTVYVGLGSLKSYSISQYMHYL